MVGEFWSGLVYFHPQNAKFFKIFYHIESLDTYMKH